MVQKNVVLNVKHELGIQLQKNVKLLVLIKYVMKIEVPILKIVDILILLQYIILL